jgi:hypothetical protein
MVHPIYVLNLKPRLGSVAGPVIQATGMVGLRSEIEDGLDLVDG